MKFQFIAREEGNHSVAALCRCLQVSTSGYYEWKKRGVGARAAARIVVTDRIVKGQREVPVGLPPGWFRSGR